MSAAVISRVAKRSVPVLALALLAGCVSVSLEQNLGRANDETKAFTDGKLSLARTQQERAQRAQAAKALLERPLSQSDAVQLALLNSPSLQALLAQSWGQSMEAAQLGRIANPVFSFERLVMGDELEFGRALSFGILDLLTLPSRRGIAQRRIEQAQLGLSSEVLERVTLVRQAWVRAVSAHQTLMYAEQVLASAQASAELARRMQAVGNYSRLSRAREQVFYADAAAALAVAKHQSLAMREDLVRQLGLDEQQANTLKLPERFPELPAQALDPQRVASQASGARLDIRLAHAQFAILAKAQGLNIATSLTDIELTARRNTSFDNAAATRHDGRGYEIAVRLPIFDWGGLQRDAMNARTLAAANQLEATIREAGSNLRESYSAYRSAYDIARHYRDEVVPLRKIISEENLLRYNGMIIGVFELLADSRDQINAVMAAIDAQQQFWLAEAALQASVMGRPSSSRLSAKSSAPAEGGAAH